MLFYQPVNKYVYFFIIPLGLIYLIIKNGADKLFQYLKKILWNIYTFCSFYYFIPLIIGVIGFCYIGIGGDYQKSCRHLLPFEIRVLLLKLLSFQSWTMIVLFVTIFCTVWGNLGNQADNTITKKQNKRLLEENDILKEEKDSKSINTYSLFSNLLYSYYSTLKLTPNERINLYFLDTTNFICVGRYSENEIFKTKPSRLYKKDIGFLHNAFTTGRLQDTEFPDPDSQFSEYIAYQMKNYSYSKEQVESFKMKSVSVLATRIQNYKHENIAVLVIESIKKDGIPFGKIDRLINDSEKLKISHLIESLKSHIHKVSDAKSGGY